MFVSSLKNLLSFSASIKDNQDIDFRGFSFPKHLHTIQLFCERSGDKLVFDAIPESLLHFGYNFQGLQYMGPVKVIIEKHDESRSLEESVEKIFGGQAVYEFD
ncbi:unnamed protein product [Ambrosiozyma monospora]|uniref:Unnamed protein product n=1 Tax=Ambrosiozyma monospora TaxID=43982 RepID=A0ACB5TE04_AMBMO|nr:unnamed protein product [Ambrosiozyma monospora]